MNLPLAIQQLRLADLLYRQGLAGVLDAGGGVG